MMGCKILNTFTRSAGLTETIVAWKSRELPNENIRSPTALSYNLSPKLAKVA